MYIVKLLFLHFLRPRIDMYDNVIMYIKSYIGTLVDCLVVRVLASELRVMS